MHDYYTLLNGGYSNSGLSKLKLTCPLDEFPPEAYVLSETLEQIDLSGTGLSSLPSDFGHRLPNLKILFLSSCAFTTFPKALASCPKLEMVAFRSNGMRRIPEHALPPRLRWLILTDNKIESLPKSIGECSLLQKCMLAGNRLRQLPQEMQNCRKLALLRLSSNRLEEVPEWLLDMPELAFLSFAGNPCSTPTTSPIATPSLTRVAWSSLKIEHTLGQGASGIISQAVLHDRSEDNEPVDVAVKLFKGTLTSDGAPEDEMAAVIAAGQHPNIIDALGQISNHPDELRHDNRFKGGLVLELIPPEYRNLGLPPSLQSCTRDCYPKDLKLPLSNALSILEGIAAAAQHLFEQGISHGDLYAHNILYNEQGHALLGDFGAATVHGGSLSDRLEKLEVLAFGHLIQDIVSVVYTSPGENSLVVDQLLVIHTLCINPDVKSRITFTETMERLRYIATI